MLNPAQRKGTAILVPGQYRGAYEIGLHRGKYQALCQRKPLKVYRDDNKNEIYDYDQSKLDEGLFGINIHKAGAFSKRVDTWSAGCQVFASDTEFKSFMNYCNKQIENGHGKTFTYTLLKEEELV
jgi:restriction endonuclease